MKKILFSFLFSFLGLIGLSSFCSADLTVSGVLPAGNYSSFSQFFYIPIPSLSFGGDIVVNCSFDNFDGTLPDTPKSDDKISPVFVNISNVNGSSLSYNGVGNISYTDFFNNHGFTFNLGSTFNGRRILYMYLQIQGGGQKITLNSPLTLNCVFSGSNAISCPACSPQYTSEECQNVYGLVSSGVLDTCNNNLQFCQASLSGRNNTLNNCSNNLLSCESSLSSCIQSNCPIDTGSVMWSSIWINGIQHLGKPVINIDIPDQIYWQYTTDDEEFNLYVGSGYDQEYIDNVIAVNSYHPTSEDFTSVFVGGLTLIMPYIFIALLILFIRKLVKRIFK